MICAGYIAHGIPRSIPEPCAGVIPAHWGIPGGYPKPPWRYRGGKQVGLCPTSACSIPIGEWQFGGACEQHGLALRPNRVVSGVSIGRHPLRWDKVGGYDRDMDDQPRWLGHVRGLNG
ncbi:MULTISPECIES: hypothetical protein [Olivibacter]|uniref:Uncharacterized protein n=1 Tax=Olivibacter jilunii TaxID=985016 RepID=A0ABW6B2D2_9SPHI